MGEGLLISKKKKRWILCFNTFHCSYMMQMYSCLQGGAGFVWWKHVTATTLMPQWKQITPLILPCLEKH